MVNSVTPSLSLQLFLGAPFVGIVHFSKAEKSFKTVNTKIHDDEILM